eukprot:9504002-Pyramimonas_sp.AAC.2
MPTCRFVAILSWGRAPPTPETAPVQEGKCENKQPIDSERPGAPADAPQELPDETPAIGAPPGPRTSLPAATGASSAPTAAGTSSLPAPAGMSSLPAPAAT